MHPETIHRRRDGSIDYDLYHRRARMLRARKVTGSIRGLAAVRKPLLLVAALAAMIGIAWPDQFMN